MTTLPQPLSQHWPYILVAYALVVSTSLALGLAAAMRMRRARARLNALEARHIRHEDVQPE